MFKITTACLTGMAVLSLLLAGFFKEYPIEMFFGAETTVALDPATHPITHRAGIAYQIDLSQLHLQGRADNADAPVELQVRFFENGQPLENEPVHARIETQPGLYSHWDHYVAFSSRQGGRPQGRYAIRLLVLDQACRWLGQAASPWMWYSVAASCLLALALLGIRADLATGPVTALLFLGLAGGFAPHVIKHWNKAITCPDSDLYVQNRSRPPLYPWFIQACAHGSAWEPSDFRTISRPLPAPSMAMLGVIRAQRLLFWSMILLAAWSVSFLVSRPLAVLFFFTLHLNQFLLPELENCLMSEMLAEAFLLLSVAAFAWILARRALWPLPVLAAAYGCLVLTRSAGAFAIVLLGVATVTAVVSHWRRKAALAGALGLAGLIGSVCLALLLWNSHARNGIWSLSPLGNWERIAFALQCADATDVEQMPDAESREFLDLALHRKKELLAAQGKADTKLEDFDLNLNCWQAAEPVAVSMFEARFGGPASGPNVFAYVHDLFGRVADDVLARRRDRYFQIVRHSFLTLASRDCTRLKWKGLSFFALLGLGLVCCLLGRNRCALASATFLLAHLANLVVMSCFELPLARYVQFSEWLCLLGFLLAGVACIQRLGNWLMSRASRSDEAGLRTGPTEQVPLQACA